MLAADERAATLTKRFDRALLKDALAVWRGQETKVDAARRALRRRAACNAAASRGGYSADLEAA
jgi:fructose-bisphosphate aldolase class I